MFGMGTGGPSPPMTPTSVATAFRRRYIKQVSLIYAYIFIFQLIGDPYEIRTRVAGVRGRSLRPLDQRATY